MLQCVLYIFLGGTTMLGSGCVPLDGVYYTDKVEYVSEYAPSHYVKYAEDSPFIYYPYNYWYSYNNSYYYRSYPQYRSRLRYRKGYFKKYRYRTKRRISRSPPRKRGPRAHLPKKHFNQKGKKKGKKKWRKK